MLDLEGKRALITGASRGIGRQVAVALAGLGCHLVLHSRQTAHTQALADELDSSGGRVTQVAADLAEPDAVESLIVELGQQGDIDILFNNAAIMVPWQQDVWAVPADSLCRSFQVNLVSQVMLCNAIVPGMISRGFGRVVNLVSGIDHEPNLAAYAVTKAALAKYTHDITPALEGSGVCMNALDPGWLRTDMGSDQAPNDVSSVLPGALVPLLIDTTVSGVRFEAQRYAGMDLDAAVAMADAELVAT